MQVNAKYLKDENGDIISPVTSSETVYTNGKNISNYYFNYYLLYEGDGTAGTGSTISLNYAWNNFLGFVATTGSSSALYRREFICVNITGLFI